LHHLQLEFDKLKAIESSKVTISELPIVYSVQIGAYNNFRSDLFSQDFSHLNEFSEEGMNKFALGNYKNYKEAVQLRTDLKKIGFKDCFIIAQSYGKPVSIKEALDLSGEEWIRGE
jgi:cell division protein FtsN